jgi:hypothetical protein
MRYIAQKVFPEFLQVPEFLYLFSLVIRPYLNFLVQLTLNISPINMLP